MSDIDTLLDRARALKREYQELTPVLRDNSGRPERRLNLQASVSTETVPVLIPESARAEWLDNDKDPCFVVQKIDIPIEANGIIYERSFFESFLGKLKDRPIPGSKSGHEMTWGKRPPTDLLLVGGKLDDTSVYFKNYIPPAGESGDNSVLIKQAKSGMIHFSLCAYTMEETGKNGEIYVLESSHGERNAVVEYGTGAMRQEVRVS